MMTERTAHDLSKYQRLIAVQSSGRVSGTFHVMPPFDGKRSTTWIKAFDVLIYADDAHSWAVTLDSGDLSGSVEDGVADYRVYGTDNQKAAVREVHDEMLQVLLTLAALEWEPVALPERTGSSADHG